VTCAPIDTLIEQAAAGDECAWRELCELVERILDDDVTAHLTPRSLAELRRIVTTVSDRIRDGEMIRLRLFLQMRYEYPQLEFYSWVRVLARGVRSR
jgi:hypothetical protein